MVDDRRARIRRNMARAWMYAAAAYAASATASAAPISWDLYGAPIGFAGGSVSATLSTPPSTPPFLTPETNNFGIARTVGATQYHTTASLSIGTASSNRRVCMIGVSRGTFAGRMVKASIGGVSATVYHDLGNVDGYSGFFIYADVPTGTVVSFSASWSAGVTNHTLEGRVLTADKTLFQNPSPVVASATGFTDLTLSVTTSANAVLMYAATRYTSIQQIGTLSSNVASMTTYQPAGWLQWGYKNSVTAQTSALNYRCITASESVALMVVTWR